MSRRLPVPIDRGATPWLFATALATTAPHVDHLPWWMSAASALMMFGALWLWQGDRRLPGRWFLALLVIAGCAGIFYEFRTLFGRDAGVAMLVLFMAMKLLELKSKRDGIVIVTLGYFLLLTHYFYSQSIPTGIWLITALWLVTATLIRQHGGPTSNTRQTLRYAAAICLQAIPFMLVLYLLFPRINGPLWGLPQDAHAGRTGLSETMSPGSISNLARSGEIAFRVHFDDAPPPQTKLYWRGPVLEVFDGKTWLPFAGRLPKPHQENLSPPIGYETTIEPHRQRWLLALDAPVSLPPESAINGLLTARSRQAINQRQRFHLTASLDYRFNAEEDPVTLDRDLALPADSNPQTLALARQWRSDTKNPDALIATALTCVNKEAFTYTLQPPLLGDDGIDQFLFQTRRGFCEHYATAFVVLMRAAGLPARVVTGYQGGEVNPVDGYLVVRQSDAHAWAEVWISGRGWIRVDPTAAVAPNRIETGIADALPSGEWLRTLRYRWEAINNAWNQQVLGYDPQRQRALLNQLGLQDADWKNLAMLLGITCTLLAIAITLLILRHRPAEAPVRRLWRQALRHLERRQVNLRPWETPLALADRLKTEAPALAAPFGRVVEAYLLAYYGDEQDLKALRLAIAQLP